MERRLLNCLVALSCIALATAQGVSPSNKTLPSQDQPLGLSVNPGDGFPRREIMMLVPLTDNASAGLENSGISGTLFPVPANAMANVTNSSIAWISCDPSYYQGELGAIDALQQAVENDAAASILYSTGSKSCTYAAGADFDSSNSLIYSMASQNQAMDVALMMDIMSGGAQMRVRIDFTERLESNTREGFNNPEDEQPGGPSPSTAVAMIILYSITGIITALFLVIIITGAIRAHRHPERYGPRAVLGRARQSRAKGLARAMLDSIPIVKFGEQENEAPKPGEVELGAAGRGGDRASPETTDQQQEPSSTETNERQGQQDTSAATAGRPSTDGAIGANTASSLPSGPPSTTEDSQGCSICTEDFERGEDVRVLPCNHKFHPPCIDPWLLNVSGTCPLCRIDLRPPTAGAGADTESPWFDSASVNAALHRGDHGPSIDNSHLSPGDETSRRRSHRLSAMILDPLNRHRMQDASPEERIQALRQYRQRNGSSGGERDQDSRRRRLSARMSALLGRDLTGSDPSRSGTPAGEASTWPVPEQSEPASPASPPPRINIQLPFDRRGEEDVSAGPSQRTDGR